MNRMQKLGIDPTTVEGMARIMKMSCWDINDELREGVFNDDCGGKDCAQCMAERLLKEIPTKKVQRGTTYTDFNKAYDDYAKENIGYSLYATGFADWLKEEIEVEE